MIFSFLLEKQIIMNKDVLIIGMSKMGKTHFGAQFYGRLDEQNKETYHLEERPNDLSLFEEVLDSLNDGNLGAHTSSNLHKTITLPVRTPKDEIINIIYPDYGGEQIRDIVQNREVNFEWKERITNSDNWFLFIRLDLMERISDVTTKFYKQIKEEIVLEDKPIDNELLSAVSSAFYIELLQIFNYVKRVKSSQKPNLTILLSCWDKLDEEQKNNLPAINLKTIMPMLYNFIRSNWKDNEFNIVGLSSLGKDLDKGNDSEYQSEGPEKFGFIIKSDGTEEKDITQILNYI
jgi:hypothetical protein